MPFITFKKPRNRGSIPGKTKVFALPTVSSLALRSTHLLIQWVPVARSAGSTRETDHSPPAPEVKNE